MRNIINIYITILILLLFSQFAFSEEALSQFEYVESDKDNHNCILDEDVAIYASKLYFEGKYLDSIRILNKVHLDHDSIYWLWKNEIAIADEVNKTPNNAFNKYIEDNPSYFFYDKALKRYIPSKKRVEESKKVYPDNEFLPEMLIYYVNIEKLKALKIKLKK